VAGSSKLHLSFHDNVDIPVGSPNVMPVDSSVVVTALSKALGWDNILILPGNYPMDVSHNPHGEVDLNVVLSGQVPMLSPEALKLLGVILLAMAIVVVARTGGGRRRGNVHVA
jgi:hypothetical protein